MCVNRHSLIPGYLTGENEHKQAHGWVKARAEGKGGGGINESACHNEGLTTGMPATGTQSAVTSRFKEQTWVWGCSMKTHQ